MTVNNRRGAPSGPLSDQKITAALDHGTVTTATVDVGTVAVAGVRTTDVVLVNPTIALKTGLALGGACCRTAGEIEIYMANPTAGTITTGTITYQVCVMKFNAA